MLVKKTQAVTRVGLELTTSCFLVQTSKMNDWALVDADLEEVQEIVGRFFLAVTLPDTCHKEGVVESKNTELSPVVQYSDEY